MWFFNLALAKLACTSSRLLLSVIFSVLLYWSAGCDYYGDHDVSSDPHYGNFASVIGTWKAIVPLYLIRCRDTEKTLLIVTNGLPYYESNDVIEFLPIGTEIRIISLIKNVSTETDLYYVKGSLTSGPYAGKIIELHWSLFINNIIIGNRGGPFPLGRLAWAVDPDKLQK